MKGYGAGIASSIGEAEVFYLFKIYLICQHFLSGKPEFRLLNPMKELNLNYPVQTL